MEHLLLQNLSKAPIKANFGAGHRHHVPGGLSANQLLFAEFVLFLPLTTTNCVLSSRCYPGTIPPDIGKLVKLRNFDMNGNELSGECERLCDHMSRRVIG